MSKSRILYNTELLSELSRFFPGPNLSEAKPNEALHALAGSRQAGNAVLYADDANSLSVLDFSKIFMAALLQRENHGQIRETARAHIESLFDSADAPSLVSVTNYIFKSLALTFQHDDSAFENHVLQIAAELHRYANHYLHKLSSSRPDYFTFPNQIEKALETLSATRQTQENVIVFVFLTGNYLDNFNIWLPLYLKHDPTGKHLFVACVNDTDNRIAGVLRAQNADKALYLNIPTTGPISSCGNGSSLGFLWYLKIRVVSYLVNQGNIVIYSDLDAYWIKDFHSVVPRIASDHVDVAFSISRDMPRYFLQTSGFTPCAGFFVIFPTAPAKIFVSHWLLMTEIMFDDQIAATELILKGRLLLRGQNRRVFFGRLEYPVMPDRAARIAFLSEDIAIRVGQPDPKTIGEATIWHPRWVLAPQNHAKVMQQIGVAT